MDALVIEQLKRGSHSAFKSIYDNYYKPMYFLAFKYLQDVEMAEDAVHHVFLSIWEGRKNIDSNLSLKSFLFTILKNYVLNQIRHQSIVQTYFVENDLNRGFGESVDDIFQAKEKLSLVRSAIDALSPQKRKICLMKLDQEMSNQDIAEQLNITVSTVKVQYSQSLRELKEKLGPVFVLFIMFI